MGAGSTAASTGLVGTLASATATPAVTLPVDRPVALDAQATFNLSAWLDSPIKYSGKVTTVTANLGGGSQARYFTASGQEVPTEALSTLGLTR